jgi:predicted MFS family arabinose efflux permease
MAPGKSSLYRNYLLGLLLLILAFNFTDRMALGLVLQQIKHDLQLTDTQLGLLTGFAFAVFYAFAGVAIARWADRGNRVRIIAVTAFLWSAMVALSGAATSFLQLLLLRSAVGVGEAGCVPPANSLIADYFERVERPRAIAIYMSGGSIAVFVGYFLAGWIDQLHGWRVMFIWLSAPGLVLGALAWCTLREPRRPSSGSDGTAQPRLKEVWRTLWQSATFRHLLFCYSVIYFFGAGISQWLPSFFVRSYGLQPAELGTWLAAVYGTGGLVGTYAGGFLASRYAGNNERLQFRVIALLFSSFGVMYALTYVVSNPHLAFVLTGLATAGVAAANGPLFGAIQSLVPERMRAVALAIVYLFANLIGMGLGPLAAGALSDALRPYAGDESLRYALLALCPGYAWGGWHLWRASRTVMRDLAAVS